MAKSKTESVNLGLLGNLMGYHLRRAQLASFNGFVEACSDLGVSPGLFAVLEVVYRNPGLTQTAVAKTLGTDRSAMVAAIDKLEKLGLLERCAAKNDRRSYALQMTQKGLQWYAEAEKRVLSHEGDIEALLKPGERELLIDILTRIASLKSS